MPALLYPVVDLVVTVVFAAIGRRNHGEGDALVGIATTAWPFVIGTLVGWCILLGLRRSVKGGARVSSGALVLLSTVVVGMLLRHLSGRGVAVSFVVVTLIFNGVLMLGWRAVMSFIERNRAQRRRAR